jgi:GTP-binding protein EngB required for normal cell division
MTNYLTKQTLLCCLLGAALCVTNCTTTKKAAQREHSADDAADRMCTCAKPMMAIIQKMDKLKDKSAEKTQLEGQLLKLAETTNACVSEIETLYTKEQNDSIFEKQVDAAMRKKCPDVMKVIDKNNAY